MANVHIFHLSPLIIPEDSHYKRDKIRPVELQQEDYNKLYDYKTIAYDIFAVGEKVIFSGPPLYNLTEIVNSKHIKINNNLVSTNQLSSIQLDRIQRSFILLDTNKKCFSLETNDFNLKVNINNNFIDTFKDKKVIITLSKNNRLEWIRDWIIFYYHNHNIDSVLLYDNNSDAYSVNDLQMYLIENLSINIDIYIVPWNFQYGPLGYDFQKDIDLPWDSDFCQLGMFEHAKERFLAKASGVINADIDELLITPNKKSIFFYLDKHPSLRYSGRWIDPVYNDDKQLHSSFFYYNIKIPSCPEKWCINPQNISKDAQWGIHKIINQKSKVNKSIYFAHIRGVNCNINRTQPIKFNQNYHIADKTLVKLYEKTYNLKISIRHESSINIFKLLYFSLKK